MGFVETQIGELIRVIDGLLGEGTVSESTLNGSVGTTTVDPGGDEFNRGQAADAWRDARDAAAAGDARLKDGDAAVAAAIAQIRVRSAQTRARLAAIRAELLELIRTPLGHTYSGMQEVADAAQARCQELRMICQQDEQLSERIGRDLMAAAAIYRESSRS